VFLTMVYRRMVDSNAGCTTMFRVHSSGPCARLRRRCSRNDDRSFGFLSLLRPYISGTRDSDRPRTGNARVGQFMQRRSQCSRIYQSSPQISVVRQLETG
jgi:hypothetical protein